MSAVKTACRRFVSDAADEGCENVSFCDEITFCGVRSHISAANNVFSSELRADVAAFNWQVIPISKINVGKAFFFISNPVIGLWSLYAGGTADGAQNMCMYTIAKFTEFFLWLSRSVSCVSKAAPNVPDLLEDTGDWNDEEQI